MSYSDSVIQAESGGDPNAANPNSSALGAGQFIAPTWVSLIRQHRPDLAQGKSDDELAAMRTDPALSKQMVDAYAGDNQAILSKAGVPVTAGSTYLAHFAGPGGAVKVLQAAPDVPVESILSADAIKANPFLKGMTAQGLQAWAAKKAGVTLPAGVPGAQPAQAPSQPATAPQLTPQFAQGAPAPAAPVQARFDPVIQAPQPIMAQQRPIDLSGLREALARQPFFARTS